MSIHGGPRARSCNSIMAVFHAFSSPFRCSPPPVVPVLYTSAVAARVLLLRPLSPDSVRSFICLATSSMSQGGSQPGSRNEAAEAEDVLVQYVVLRRDLIDSWPLGSVVTQGCHASVAAIWSHKDDPLTLRYCDPQNIDSMHKVTLEVKGETQMLKLSEKLKAGGIDHKLWVEQPENFPTCLATKPYPKSLVSSFFKKLKLCK